MYDSWEHCVLREEDGARRKSVKEIQMERHGMIGEEKFDTKQVTIETAEKGAVLKGVSLQYSFPVESYELILYNVTSQLMDFLWSHLERFPLQRCEVNSQHNEFDFRGQPAEGQPGAD